MDFRPSPANTTNKLKSVIGSTTRVEIFTTGSNWLASRHGIEKVAVERVTKAKAFSNYILENEYETMKVFERENISVTRPNSENVTVT